MRKLKRKPEIMEEMKKEPVKKRIILKYKKRRCDFIHENGERCRSLTSGKGNFCVTHSNFIFKEERNTSSVMPSNNNLLMVRYDPINHPIEYIRLSKEGLNLSEIAAEFQVSTATIIEWKDIYPIFNMAFEIGKAAHEAWYLQQGKSNLDNRFFQTPLFKFLTMNNGMGWSDKAETKSTQQGNFGVLLIPGQMSIDEWEQKNIEEDKKIQEIFDSNLVSNSEDSDV